MKKAYSFIGEVWLYPSEVASWHFVTINKKLSSDIKKKYRKKSRGFGSLPVKATIGKTKWQTSIFPNRKDGTYILPLKAVVREKEDIRLGEKISIKINVLKTF